MGAAVQLGSDPMCRQPACLPACLSTYLSAWETYLGIHNGDFFSRADGPFGNHKHFSAGRVELKLAVGVAIYACVG